MVSMEVCIDDDVDLFRGDAESLQSIQQSSLRALEPTPFLLPGVELVAVACVHQDALPAGLDEERPRGKADPVQGVRGVKPFPHDPGYQPEDASPVYPEEPIVDEPDLNVANLHEAMAAVNAEKNLVRRLPSQKQVADWVEQAKTLPPKVTY